MEGNREEGEGIGQIAEQCRHRRCHPPGPQLAQSIEYRDIQQLADHIGHEAGERDACHEQIPLGQRLEPGEPAPGKDHRDDIGHQQRREHDPKDDARAGSLPNSRTVRSVARKMKGKLKAPQVVCRPKRLNGN